MSHTVIVGGGIGGLAVAIALQQQDMEAHVYEAAPALEPVGAGIWVPTNAMQVFGRLQLSQSIARRGVALERIEIQNDAGKRMQQIDLQEVQKRFGHTTISIHRGALQEALAEMLVPGTLHLGKTCIGVEEQNTHVRVDFDDGTHVEAPFVIGADGIHSTVRAHLFPEARLRYAGQTCYRGIADLQLPPALRQTARETWGAGQRFGFSAIGAEAVYWFAPVDATPGTSMPAMVKSDLLRRYAAFPEPTAAILDHTPVDAIIQADLYDLHPLDRWARGRIVLLGDAAHAPTPNLGQGAAQAIEDAYVLAVCLAQYDEHAAAFAAYEETRMSKAKQVVRRSRQLGRLAHLKHPVARRLRNTILRYTPAFIQRRERNALYALAY